MRILIVGSGAREHAITKALSESKTNPKLYCYGSQKNPGILNLVEDLYVGEVNDPQSVAQYAKSQKIDMAIVGSDNPLAAGVADALWEVGVKTVGPSQKHARIEWSKTFARDLMYKYDIDASPKYKFFTKTDYLKDYLDSLNTNFVIKANGLHGGKGVYVQGDHFETIQEALEICGKIAENNEGFLIEEKLEGPEFSLFSFTDGIDTAEMPIVQDHKRAYEGDKGPNTGGMGSYSLPNHSLSFLTESDIIEATRINQAIIKAMNEEFGDKYKGVLYGGFMKTKNGVKVIEFNSRFGDPEAMNLLSLLESDFVEICEAITDDKMSQTEVKFANKATVCKYLVPNGYPNNPIKNELIDLSGLENWDDVYFGSISIDKEGIYKELGSRTIAICSVADTVKEAEQKVEEKIKKIKGPLFYRSDIAKNIFT